MEKVIPRLGILTTARLVKKHGAFMPGMAVDIRDTYGPVAFVDFLKMRYYMVTHPELVNIVLKGDYRSFTKPKQIYNVLEPHFGNGLVSNDGDDWVRQRRLSAPFFMKKQLDAAIPIILSEVETVKARWRSAAKSGEPIDVARDLNTLTFKILCRVVFGENLEQYMNDLYREILTLIELVPQRGFSLVQLPFWIPTPFNRRFTRSAKNFRRLIAEIVEKARQNPEASRAGMIAHLIRQESQTEGEDVIDILSTMMGAGFETTANAISWVFGLLAQNPETQAKLAREIDEKLGSAPLDGTNMNDVTHATWVIQEALRLYPPALYPSRYSVKPVEADGYRIPAGSIIQISIWATQRNPNVWDQADRFIPERFSPERITERQLKAYIPFVAGPRECMGKQLALYELQLMTVAMAREFSFELAPGFTLEPMAQMLMRPKNGVQVILKERALDQRAPQPTAIGLGNPSDGRLTTLSP